MRDRPDLLTHSCGRCGARWSGLDRAHCTACPAHRTFDDVELYEVLQRRSGLTGQRRLVDVLVDGGEEHVLNAIRTAANGNGNGNGQAT